MPGRWCLRTNPLYNPAHCATQLRSLPKHLREMARGAGGARRLDPARSVKWIVLGDKTESLAEIRQVRSIDVRPSQGIVGTSPIESRQAFESRSVHRSEVVQAVAGGSDTKTAKTRARGGLVTSHVRMNYAGPAQFEQQ